MTLKHEITVPKKFYTLVFIYQNRHYWKLHQLFPPWQCAFAMLGFFHWFLFERCYVENYAAHHLQHTHWLSLSVSFPSMSFHSFSPSDQKFATGSDDGTVRIWDFYRCYEEKVLRGKEKFSALFLKSTLLSGIHLVVFWLCLKKNYWKSKF